MNVFYLLEVALYWPKKVIEKIRECGKYINMLEDNVDNSDEMYKFI